jgi:ABC-2 type transport system permease protein
MSLLRAIVSSFVVQLKLRVVSPLSWFAVILQPVVFSVVALVLVTGTGHREHVGYAVLGGGLVGLWGATLYNAGLDIQAERWNGTLEEICGCPTPLAAIVAGKVAASIAVAAASFVACLAVAYLGFGASLRLDPLPFAASLLLTVASFYSVGLILAPFLVLIRLVAGLVNVLELPLYLLCGFMFPSSVLPGWVQPLSAVLAPTWSIRAMYASAGEAAPHYLTWWLAMLALLVVNAAVSAALFRLVDRRVRVTGQLATV